MIIFIAALLVAGITANVLIQTMNTLQQQALETGTETIREISSGIRVTHTSGYYNGTAISLLAIFISPSAGSEAIDLERTYISLSDSSTRVILNYTENCFSGSVTNGLFNTINSSNLSATTFGVLVIRDSDSSCLASNPVINYADLVVLLVNTSECFSGIGTRTEVSGSVYPEYGMSGVFSFVTPSAFVDTIIDF